MNHTGTYSAILSQNGDFHVAVGDMDIHKVITPDNVRRVCQHGGFSVGYKKYINNSLILAVTINEKSK